MRTSVVHGDRGNSMRDELDYLVLLQVIERQQQRLLQMAVSACAPWQDSQGIVNEACLKAIRRLDSRERVARLAGQKNGARVGGYFRGFNSDDSDIEARASEVILRWLYRVIVNTAKDDRKKKRPQQADRSSVFDALSDGMINP